MTTIDYRQGARGVYTIRRDGTDVLGVQIVADLPTPSALVEHLTRAVAAFYGAAPSIGGRIDWSALGWLSEAQHDEMWQDVLAQIPDDYAPAMRDQIRDDVRTARAAGVLPASPPYSVDQLDALDKLVRAVTQPAPTRQEPTQ